MAHFVKNDTNYHGARSKTRAVENGSKKQENASKNYGKDDDGWGPIPKSSSGASNCGDGWGDIPQDSSTSDNAWGQDRLVHGKAERNRRFHSNKNNSTFRVPNQSRPIWDNHYEEFPVLGSGTAPTVNVWEKRKEKFEEIRAIEPTNQTEEERMIQKAIELSKMEISHEEEKRRELEEEYKLQMQLLEANPDMFEEFRLGEKTDKATAGKFVSEPYEVENGYKEESDFDEIGENSIDHGGWGSTCQKTMKKKDLMTEQKIYEFPREDDSNPKLKQDSWSQPAERKSSYSGARPKISKVVDMFGGWGTAKPATTRSHHDNVEDVPKHRSSKWETVDVEFVSKSCNQKPVKPINEVPNTDPPEAKIENTYSNWNASVVETATELSDWETAEVETTNKLSNWDAVETIDTNSRNSSENETCKVPRVERNQQEDTIKIISKDKSWGSDSEEAEISSRKSDNFELNSENYIHEYASCQKDKKVESRSEQKNYKSKADLKTQSKGMSLLSDKDMKETTACFDEEITSDLGTGQTSEINKHEYQLGNFEQSQGISPKMYKKHAEIKEEIKSLEDKCPDSQGSVEKEYAFLLSGIDSNAQSKTPNQISSIQTADQNSRSTSSFTETAHQFETSQSAKRPASAFGVEDAFKDLPIPGPHPLYTNYNEAPSSTTFDEFPGQVHNYDLPSFSKTNESHIDPPKAAGPIPELLNPLLFPQPMMAPSMNPMMAPSMNPMMGMNPLLTPQMMVLCNPFFVQQWQQMEMYYKSLGMSLGSGMPMYPQPMPLLNFANNPNPQVFSNLMGTSSSSAAATNGMIPPPLPTASASSPPGINANHLSTDGPYEVDQPDDNFWFENYMSSGSSSLIPPPKPTPENLPAVTPETKIDPTAFASLSLGATSKCNEDLSSARRNVSSVPEHQPYESSNKSPEVPNATGWGDFILDSKSNEASGWNDDVDGWGSGNASAARSIRNPSRHITEKTTCRQPVSRPNLGRTKT